MFRNQYDNDVTVWSPQGRLHQVEYAMEAVKQGSASVGLKSKTHAVVVALKRAPSELSAHQKKIFRIDDHVGVSIAGLTSDARILNRFMETECLNHQFVKSVELPISRLVNTVTNKLQTPTQHYGRRPYGVGMLVVGYDEQGSHLYQLCPSSNVYECKAMGIGARSQSARTYLEKFLDTFPDCGEEELVSHALRALRDCLPNEVDLTNKNTSIAIVGKDRKFVVYEDEETDPYLAKIEGEERRGRPAQAEEAAAEPAPAGEEAMES